MIVVDTNVIAHLLLPGDPSAACDRLRKKEPEWMAPFLWRDEFTNLLCTLERQGAIDARQSMELLKMALQLMGKRGIHVSPHRVLSVARNTGCSGYDSQFIALAEDLGVKLYTFDKLVLKKCPNLAVRPR